MPQSLKCPESALREIARAAGACACGIVKAGKVADEAVMQYEDWLEAGRHGSMQYCEKYRDVRDDPRLLLSGCKWLIVCAFSYNPGPLPPSRLKIARYALGRDYHTVIAARLARIADFLKDNYGGETMTAVDTKPLRERYWAMRAGIGAIGHNNQLIVPGFGSYVLIGTVLWTGEIEPEATAKQPVADVCGDCTACVKACPGKALRGDGSCDCTRCLSYLTIEHKGGIPEGTYLRGWLYGCDVCQEVCPHNRTAPATEIEEFLPRAELIALDRDAIMAHSGRSWRRFLGDSAMTRVPLKKLLDTLSRLR